MRFGVHIRIAEGLVKALDQAKSLRCEAVQLFSSNPNSWQRKPLDPDQAAEFSAKATALGIHPVILHTPYLLNLAAPDDGIWRKSKDTLADAMVRASAIGARFVVTHIGSHKGAGYESGVRRIAEAAEIALDASPEPFLALELGSGSGNSIGWSFAQIADIIGAMSDAARVRICIDTAHLWGAGYNISTQAGVDSLFEELKSRVGLDRLGVVHLNDTLMALDSRRDRHHHIGKGLVGLDGFRAIVNYPLPADTPGIIETPAHTLHWDRRNLATLRRLRAGAPE